MNLIFALVFSSALLLTAASPPPPPALQGCTDELVSLSPCLGYISEPPNNVTDAVDPQCCSAFSRASDSGDGNCFCYLLRQPLIFGFPLNQSRLLSLPSDCSSFSNASRLGSLKAACSGAPALPPLQSTPGSTFPEPSDSGGDDLVMAPSTNAPTESDAAAHNLSSSSLPPPPPPPPPDVVVTSPPPRVVPPSSATKLVCSSCIWALPGVLGALVLFSV